MQNQMQGPLKPEHLQLEDLMTLKGDNDPKLVQIIREYLDGFVKMEDGKCFKCGAGLAGKDLISSFLSSFQWGIIHGEGFCFNCSWPARAYHSVKDKDGEIMKFTAILQYHPDYVKLKDPNETL